MPASSTRTCRTFSFRRLAEAAHEHVHRMTRCRCSSNFRAFPTTILYLRGDAIWSLRGPRARRQIPGRSHSPFEVLLGEDLPFLQPGVESLDFGGVGVGCLPDAVVQGDAPGGRGDLREARRPPGTGPRPLPSTQCRQHAQPDCGCCGANLRLGLGRPSPGFFLGGPLLLTPGAGNSLASACSPYTRSGFSSTLLLRSSPGGPQGVSDHPLGRASPAQPPRGRPSHLPGRPPTCWRGRSTRCRGPTAPPRCRGGRRPAPGLRWTCGTRTQCGSQPLSCRCLWAESGMSRAPASLPGARGRPRGPHLVGPG